MGNRGPKPKETIKTKWSTNLAYAVGLFVTDGSLSKDGRHIDFTSKDKEQINNLLKCIKLELPIYEKLSGDKINKSFRIQISSVIFYNFLLSIGIFPKKSKNIGKIDIPDPLFSDFLRGCFDGDGSFYSYKDTRWKNSFMFYVSFNTASKDHAIWLQYKCRTLFGVSGHISKAKKSSIYSLRFAKKEGLEILGIMYYNHRVTCLSRKKKKIQQVF